MEDPQLRAEIAQRAGKHLIRFLEAIPDIQDRAITAIRSFAVDVTAPRASAQLLLDGEPVLRLEDPDLLTLVAEFLSRSINKLRGQPRQVVLDAISDGGTPLFHCTVDLDSGKIYLLVESLERGLVPLQCLEPAEAQMTQH